MFFLMLSSSAGPAVEVSCEISCMSRPAPDDDVKVTLAALLHLVRLLSAELVAGKHREDINLVESAIRAKVNQIAVQGVSAEAVARGLAYAHELLGPVLSNVRAQA